MRRPRVRISLRAALVAVALAGVALGGGLALARRRAVFTGRAERHRLETNAAHVHCRVLAATIRAQASPARSGPRAWAREAVLKERREDLERCRTTEVYHAELARKYERAARYPWLPVEPDPPEPK